MRAVPVQKTSCGKLLILIMLIVIPLFSGCIRKQQPQRKPVSNAASQEIKIAVSLADMERDGNKTIKQTMSARQGGQQGQQGQQGQGQQGQQGQKGQQGQQAGQGGGEAVPVQAGGAQGGQQGQQKVEIIWLDAKNDPNQQERDLEQLVNQNVKAVLLQVVDPESGPRLVRRLLQANIKVIALETLPANCPVDGYISSDHARTGELLANFTESIARGSTSPVRVVLLKGDRNDQASREIASALLERLNKMPQVRVILVQDHPRGDPGQAAATVERVLTETSNQIEAILATDSRMAAAAAEVLKNRGLSQKIVTAGVGADQQASRALVAGEHEAEVDLMPEMIAQYAYDALVGLASTGYWQYDRQVKNGDFDVPAKITPVRLITREESYLLEQRWGPLAGQQGQQGQSQQAQQDQQKQNNQGQNQQRQNQQEQGQQGQNGQDQQGRDSQGRQEQNQQGGRKTTLRVTTRDGKTVEVQIDGEIKKIETMDGTAGGGQGGSQGGSQGEGS